MKIFIAGICGTFMAGIAQIAKAAGHRVSGCDANVYPPMSTLLSDLGIPVKNGYHPEHIDADTDQVIIGNALSRGNELVEWVLNKNLDFQSGPGWLHDQILKHRAVIAVAGTHGKTSTSSMVTWILHVAGKSPGFLIGGKPGNFEHSAEIGEGKHFVIEADEYDTAFFDKRSKFVHYHPHIAVLNNLEFDHADIFSDLEQIKTQFHHLLRIVPSNGHVVINHDDPNLDEVLQAGCWSDVVAFSVSSSDAPWYAEPLLPDCSRFTVFQNGQMVGEVRWQCIGKHNMQNALAAIAAASLSGVAVQQACEALSRFIPTDRRLQLLFDNGQVSLYEDFAHHPTAISETLTAIRNKYPERKIIAIVEPRSNTMQMGCHRDTLGQSLDEARTAILYQPKKQDWDAAEVDTQAELIVCENKAEVLRELGLRIAKNSVIICMSNGSFDGIPLSIKELCNSAENLLSNES